MKTSGVGTEQSIHQVPQNKVSMSQRETRTDAYAAGLSKSAPRSQNVLPAPASNQVGEGDNDGRGCLAVAGLLCCLAAANKEKS